MELNLEDYLKTDEYGINYYEIPKGFVLYRGDSNPKYKEKMVFGPEDKERFFGFDQETTEGQYGVTFEFKTKRQLKLLALDKNNTDEFLGLVESRTDKGFDYNKLLDILNNNYGYVTGTRDSVSEKDNYLSRFISVKLKEFDGYACVKMKKQGGGIFHAEAMICNPKDKLTIGERVTEGDLKDYYDNWRLINQGKYLGKKNANEKRARSLIFDQENSESPERNTFMSPVKGPFDYNDDTYNSPDGNPPLPYDTYNSPDGNPVLPYDTYNSPDRNNYESPLKKTRLPYNTYNSPGGRGGKRKTKRKQRKTKRNQKKTTRRRKRQTK
jgi:hypothetical protein